MARARKGSSSFFLTDNSILLEGGELRFVNTVNMIRESIFGTASEI